MSGWLDIVIVSVLVIWALVYVTLSVLKKFKRPACGEDCACAAKKLRPPRKKFWFRR
ncbi:MAG: hypothetical protein LBK60_12235 [Verrucomicrobiales bacterium]|jgi:hypothetical protein|nr:hypothetical protein [Verrucomicrobiales bacterium]